MLAALLSALSVPAQAAVPAAERAWLVRLYSDTAGAGWTDHTNWLTGDPCVDGWYGITCDAGNAHVIKINLASNNLVGALPAGLNGLTSLQDFYAANNQLTGSIPALTGLTSLQEFQVGNNQLTGSIPALTGLTSLQDFYAYQNELTGSIPALAGLTNLMHFDVGSNQLTGSIPALTGLTGLWQFSVSNNQLTGSIPVLTGLSSLLGFDASENRLVGSIPALTGSPSLQYFYAYSNQLTGSIPALTGLTRLMFFYVDNNQLTGPIPDVPSPSALQANNSSLCLAPGELNTLTYSANPATNTAWNTATTGSAVTDWATSCRVMPVGAPVITTPVMALPGGTVGTAYSTTLTASGAPTGWDVTGGALPAVLTLGTSGKISGTPTTAGTYYFNVIATNAAGQSTAVTYSITVVAARLLVTNGTTAVPTLGQWALLLLALLVGGVAFARRQRG